MDARTSALALLVSQAPLPCLGFRPKIGPSFSSLLRLDLNVGSRRTSHFRDCVAARSRMNAAGDERPTHGRLRRRQRLPRPPPMATSIGCYPAKPVGSAGGDQESATPTRCRPGVVVASLRGWSFVERIARGGRAARTGRYATSATVERWATLCCAMIRYAMCYAMLCITRYAMLWESASPRDVSFASRVARGGSRCAHRSLCDSCSGEVCLRTRMSA